MIDPCPVVAESWEKWYPAVGTFIAVLAGLGVIVPWLSGEKPRRVPKLLWSFIFVGLVLLELRSIRLDSTQRDRDQAHAQCVQLDGFKQIAKGIEDSNDKSREQFAATMKELGVAIDTETGGDTFCYLDFIFQPKWENGKQTERGYLILNLVRVGKYPLRDVSLTLDDHTKFSQISYELRKPDTNDSNTPAGAKMVEASKEGLAASSMNIPVGNFAIDHKILTTYPMNEGDSQEFDVLIRSFNSEMLIERVVLKATNGHWSKAILVELPKRNNRFWVKIDKDFPKKNGHLDVNWPRPVVGRASWDH